MPARDGLGLFVALATSIRIKAVSMETDPRQVKDCSGQLDMEASPGPGHPPAHATTRLSLDWSFYLPAFSLYFLLHESYSSLGDTETFLSNKSLAHFHCQET